MRERGGSVSFTDTLGRLKSFCKMGDVGSSGARGPPPIENDRPPFLENIPPPSIDKNPSPRLNPTPSRDWCRERCREIRSVENIEKPGSVFPFSLPSFLSFSPLLFLSSFFREKERTKLRFATSNGSTTSNGTRRRVTRRCRVERAIKKIRRKKKRRRKKRREKRKKKKRRGSTKTRRKERRKIRNRRF